MDLLTNSYTQRKLDKILGLQGEERVRQLSNFAKEEYIGSHLNKDVVDALLEYHGKRANTSGNHSEWFDAMQIALRQRMVDKALIYGRLAGPDYVDQVVDVLRTNGPLEVLEFHRMLGRDYSLEDRGTRAADAAILYKMAGWTEKAETTVLEVISDYEGKEMYPQAIFFCGIFGFRNHARDLSKKAGMSEVLFNFYYTNGVDGKSLNG